MLVFCIYNNGALADKDHVIYGWVKHGHCPGTLIPDAVDSTYLFGPSLLMLVVVEKTSRVIEDIIWLKNRDEKNPHLARPYPHHENNVTYEMVSFYRQAKRFSARKCINYGSICLSHSTAQLCNIKVFTRMQE